MIREFATDFQPPQQAVTGGTGLYAGEQDLFVLPDRPARVGRDRGRELRPGILRLELRSRPPLARHPDVLVPGRVPEPHRLGRHGSRRVHPQAHRARCTRARRNPADDRSASSPSATPARTDSSRVIRKAMETKLGDDAEETFKERLQERNPAQRGKGGHYHSPRRRAASPSGRVVDALTRLVATEPVCGRSDRGGPEGGPTPHPRCIRRISCGIDNTIRSRGSSRGCPAGRAQAQPESQPQSAAEPQTEKKQPVFTWSHPTGSGRIEIAVWDKTVSTDNGERVVYSVTCQRSYRKQEGGFENTGTFWPTDLLVLAHGLEVVFDRIKEMQQGEPF